MVLSSRVIGKNVTSRNRVLTNNDKPRSYIDEDIILPAATLQEFYIYVPAPPPNVIYDALSSQIWLQIWRPRNRMSVHYRSWQLVWQRLVEIDPTQTDALYTVSHFTKHIHILVLRRCRW
jgi:hypothetical protein